MPKPNSSDITFVLDRSGSMADIADDTIGGYNRLLADQKAEPGEATFTLVQFDNKYEVVYAAVPIADVPELTRGTFVPRGGTALLDAIGRTINETGARLAALPEEERPSTVIVVVITDGYENQSKEFIAKWDAERRVVIPSPIAEMIRHQQDVYNWTFLFLGADQDAIETAGGIGIAAANSLTYAKSAQGVAATYDATSSLLKSTRSTGHSTGFTADDRTKSIGG